MENVVKSGKKDIPVIACLALIAVLGMAAYFNSLSGDLVWDDKLLIEGNNHIKNISFIKEIFREDLFHMSDIPTGYYRPIQVVSYMADYLLWGKTPIGYHITSILIQIFNSSLVFFLCLLLMKDRLKSLLVASVFCVHPAFVAIGGYISGRADLLGMAFSLLAIYLVIRYIIRGTGKIALWVSLLLYALAVISKEYYIITPLFVLFFIFVYGDKYRTDNKVKFVLIGMFIILGIYASLRATVLNFHQPMGVISEQVFSTRLAVFPWIIAKYVGTLVLPVDLGMEKRLEYASLAEPRFILSYAVPILVAAALYLLYRAKKRDEFFFLGWFAIGILPVSNLIMPLKAILADHWTYMPSVGFFAFFAAAAGSVKSPVVRKAIAVAVSCVIVVFIALTIKENTYWRTEDALYARILEKNPHSSRTIYNNGRLSEEKGDNKKALELYDKAIKESAGGKGMYYNARGMLYKKMGDVEKASHDFEAAVQATPSAAIYHVNLGCSYAELGKGDMARAEWEAALKIDPNDELARKNMGIMMERGGR